MEFFFNPKSIALVGASPTRGRWGNRLLRNIMRGYKGALYPVNARYDEVEGLKCHPTARSIGEPVELGIVLVPAPMVPEALRDCASAGVKGVIIESAGFSETGEQGKALEEECRRIGRETGIRVWGPNCYGLVDAHRGHVFTFAVPDEETGGLVAGPVSLVVQSGMLAGTLIVDIMSGGAVGIAKACSIGNKIDVDETDLLEYLLADPKTATIALYLEAVPKGRKLIDMARRAGKPIVVLKGGSSPQGAKAAISHTASLAGDDRIVRGALAQAHVIQATDVVQMTDLAHALSIVPQGVGQGRVAVITLSGGAGILSADLLHASGLRLASLSPESLRSLGQWFPDWMPVSNPVDIGPAATSVGVREAYCRAAEIVCADPGVDVLLVQANVGAGYLEPDISSIGASCRDSGKAAFAWVMGDYDRRHTICVEAARLGIPAYHDLQRAVEAIHAVYDYGRHRRGQESLREERVSLPNSFVSAMEALDRSGVLDEFDSKRVLNAAGIPTVREEIVTDPESAVRIASQYGFPVVLKGVAPDKVHKTELGLVRLGLRDADEVRAAYSELGEKLNGSGRILLQEQVPVDCELFCGMVRDPALGTSVAFGLGGVLAELHQDVVFRVAPLTRTDALDMMDSIRSRRILDGLRGKAPVDREALATVLMTLGEIGLEWPRVSEIDMNPLASFGGRLLALDATLVLRPEPPVAV